MQLTKRDISIIKSINAFGCVDIGFISDLFDMKPKIAYRRLRMLVLENFLERETILHKTSGVYRVTPKGVDASLDSLPAMKKISMGTYQHHLLVAKLSTKLIRKYGGDFITERHMRHDSEFSGVGIGKHLCDGELKFPDKKIAIEVELTPKGKRRLDTIIKGYRKNLAYQEVWYFYGNNEVRNKLEKCTAGMNFIKLFDLSDYVER